MNTQTSKIILPVVAIGTTMLAVWLIKNKGKKVPIVIWSIKTKQNPKVQKLTQQQMMVIPQETIQWVFLNQNHNQQILTPLLKYTFKNLTRLSVSENQITSFQGLSRMELSQLSYLQLQNNKISNLQTLRKLNAPNLHLLQLNNNPITTNIENFSQANFGELQFLWIQQFITDHLTSENISWMFRTQSQYLRRLYLGSQERIQINGEIQQKLTARFMTFFQLRLNNNV